MWWTSHFPGLKPTLFLNGIDTERYDGDITSERLIDVLYVGRYLEHKGAGDILHALQPDHVAVFAGNGPYLNELKSIASSRNLTNATFYDAPSSETIAGLYKQAKIFACPSRAKEGLLTTLLEAGASGCAVVTASGSGMTDLITDKQNGLVVEPANAIQLQAAFEYLLHNSTDRLALATQLQSDIKHGWSWENRAMALKDIYQNAAK
jgi:glycosyltransferase involved in cell wall biosynthesis